MVVGFLQDYFIYPVEYSLRSLVSRSRQLPHVEIFEYLQISAYVITIFSNSVFFLQCQIANIQFLLFSMLHISK